MKPETVSLIRNLITRVRGRRYRTLREFAEAEIVVPTGRFQDQRFDCMRQPYTSLLYDAIDSNEWQTIVALGPSQSGKSLSAFVVPILWHLFELRETVLVGAPDLNAVADKWALDLLPVIERTRYANLLPESGEGSRGGKARACITFRNGVSLRFMTAGGGDKGRSYFTTRVLVITEADGFDEMGKSSRESTKIKQLQARQRSYPRHMRRTYAECTVSVKTGFTWQQYTRGSESRIATRCPHCKRYVTLEREHLLGWEEAETEIEAGERAMFYCYRCGQGWSEIDRRIANEEAILVHRGQVVSSAGNVHGPRPKTRVLGFRWNAANNLMLSASDFGEDAWNAERAEDEVAEEKEQCQFVWAVPWEPPELDIVPLKKEDLIERQEDPYRRGFVPEDTEALIVGLDPGKRYLWYVVTAWRACGRGCVIDYGVDDVAGDDMDEELALLKAFREFDERAREGWPVFGSSTFRPADRILIDSGYNPDEVVYKFVREANRAQQGGPGLRTATGTWLPTKGFGEKQYRRPRALSERIKRIGWQYHVARIDDIARRKVTIVEQNSDAWKTWIHNRLQTPADQRGALTLFKAPPREHLKFVAHLTSEKQTEEFIAGRGVVMTWERLRRSNHWLDCVYQTAVGGHLHGFRIVSEEKRRPLVGATRARRK